MCKSMKYEFLKMQTKPLKSQPKGVGKGGKQDSVVFLEFAMRTWKKIYAQHTYLPQISLQTKTHKKKLPVELIYCLIKVSQPELLPPVQRVTELAEYISLLQKLCFLWLVKKLSLCTYDAYLPYFFYPVLFFSVKFKIGATILQKNFHRNKRYKGTSQCTWFFYLCRRELGREGRNRGYGQKESYEVELLWCT